MKPLTRYVPNNRSFGKFMLTRRGNPAHAEAVRVAHMIAAVANDEAAAVTHKKPTEQQKRLRINPNAGKTLAGSYKVRDAYWVSKEYPNVRSSQMVYSDDNAALFNEVGVRADDGTRRQERHFLRNAAIFIARARNGGV